MNNPESLQLMQELCASYEQGVKSISPIFAVAAVFLEADWEQAGEKDRLRETLAHNGNLRKKDFDLMLDSLAETQRHGEQNIHLLLRDYLRSQQEIVSQLSAHFADARRDMAGGDLQRIKLTAVQIRSTLARQAQARRDLENRIVEFEKERSEINSNIKELLQKGGELRVRDFKEMLARIKDQRKNRIEENKVRRETVSQMLAGFKQQRTAS